MATCQFSLPSGNVHHHPHIPSLLISLSQQHQPPLPRLSPPPPPRDTSHPHLRPPWRAANHRKKPPEPPPPPDPPPGQRSESYSSVFQSFLRPPFISPSTTVNRFLFISLKASSAIENCATTHAHQFRHLFTPPAKEASKTRTSHHHQIYVPYFATASDPSQVISSLIESIAAAQLRTIFNRLTISRTSTIEDPPFQPPASIACNSNRRSSGRVSCDISWFLPFFDHDIICFIESYLYF